VLHAVHFLWGQVNRKAQLEVQVLVVGYVVVYVPQKIVVLYESSKVFSPRLTRAWVFNKT